MYNEYINHAILQRINSDGQMNSTHLTSPECVLSLPLTSYIMLGLLSILHNGISTAAFGASGSDVSGMSSIAFCNAARMAAKERLVRGEVNEK